MAESAETVERAERLYIEERKTPQQIAEAMGLGEKTIRNWRDKYGWAEKRAHQWQEMEALSAVNLRVARKMIERMEADLDAGAPVSMVQVAFLNALMGGVSKMRKVESEDAAKSGPAALPMEVTPDMVDAANKALELL